MNEVLLLITTDPDEKNAKCLAKLLIEKKLAACVSIKKIFSIYKWNENFEETQEFEITIKTKPALRDELIICLKEITSYEIPQIIFKEFNCETNYDEWLKKSL